MKGLDVDLVTPCLVRHVCDPVPVARESGQVFVVTRLHNWKWLLTLSAAIERQNSDVVFRLGIELVVR
jgi:hypothetical protein